MRTINLIPPEGALRAAARRKNFGFLVLGLLYVVLLAAGFLYFQGQAGEVDDRLATQQTINQELEADIAALAAAAELEAEFVAGIAHLESTLASDIAWGRLLNDLGRVIPDRVWLESFSAQAIVDLENPASFGTVSFNGTAFDFPDAASWLRTLDSDRWPAIDTGWVLTTNQGDIFEGVSVVQFSSVGSLTDAALDERAAGRIPTVPQ